ncbi:hypothetical protein OF846_005270 [Rhodotorula toruloides]|nr:hypothetical protein OF846_005270 [Rhodotorula toruloides]
MQPSRECSSSSAGSNAAQQERCEGSRLVCSPSSPRTPLSLLHLTRSPQTSLDALRDTVARVHGLVICTAETRTACARVADASLDRTLFSPNRSATPRPQRIASRRCPATRSSRNFAPSASIRSSRPAVPTCSHSLVSSSTACTASPKLRALHHPLSLLIPAYYDSLRASPRGTLPKRTRSLYVGKSDDPSILPCRESTLPGTPRFAASSKKDDMPFQRRQVAADPIVRPPSRRRVRIVRCCTVSMAVEEE